MSTHTLFARFRQTLRNFRSASSGNVAITLGLALIPLVASVGAAVDFSRFNSVKADLQGALDSTALALAKEAQSDTKQQLDDNTSAFFTASFTPE